MARLSELDGNTPRFYAPSDNTLRVSGVGDVCAPQHPRRSGEQV